MPKKQIALSLIAADFAARPPQAYSYSQIAELQSANSRKWQLPPQMGARTFIQLLLDETKLSKRTPRSRDYDPLIRYIWGDHISPLALALSIRKSAYLSHGSALWVHGLGGQERHIFVNTEQSDKEAGDSDLTQEAIHRTFQNQPRQSRLVYSMPKMHITVINGKYTGELEVQTKTGPAGENLRVTSLERTLIDIVVRPIYSGGVQAVLNAYRLARERASARKIATILLSCMVSGNVSLGFGQASDPKSSAVVDQIMTTALSRCYSTIDGVKRISFVSPTNEEFADVEALGRKAIVPLARYLDLQPKNDFRQLFAVKFLMAIGGPSTLGPLKRAFAQDQWEVTRAAALDGIFAVSHAEAKPYVEAAVGDKSQLVRQRAHDLWSLYQGQIK